VADNSDVFMEALLRARQNVADLKQQRATIDAQIAKWEQTVRALSAVHEPTFPIDFPKPPLRISEKPDGLKNSILDILKVAHSPLTPTEIKKHLDERHYEWANRQNALPSVHTVLRRLIEEIPEVACFESEREGKIKVAYLWVGNIR
jgi:hypothetical protein